MALDALPPLAPAARPPSQPRGAPAGQPPGGPAGQPPGGPAGQTTGRPSGPVLWLVRHGESTWNALGLAQGQSDVPRLTSRGTCQAWYAANQLRGRAIGAVYASDLRRATATAAPLAAALGLATSRDSRLRERGLGVLEGARSVDVPAALSGVSGNQVIDPDARPPDGESLRDLYRRVADFADRVLSPGLPRELAVVAHGGTLRVLTAYLRGVPVERMAWEPLGNGCIVRLQPNRAFSQ